MLETAYFAGYFAEKRETSGVVIAESLGISGPTFHHLRAAQRRLLAALLGSTDRREDGG